MLGCLLRRGSFIVATLTLGVGPAGEAAAQQRQAPADWGAVSIGLEDLPYPHPVQLLPLQLEGEEVFLAYMDVPPVGPGNGQTAVLLHGMNFFGEYWASTIEALTAAGYRVVVPDQVGYGRSSKPILAYNLHIKAANTRKLLQHLGIDRAAIIGHSMGGMVATRFAFSYPEMASHLVLVNQIGLTDARLDRPWRDTEEIYRANLSRSYEEIRVGQERYYVEWKPEYEKYVRIHYGWTLSADWPRMARVRALQQQVIYMDPVVYEWPHIQTRALVIGGEEDGPNYPALARAVAEALPHSELILFPRVGHNPHLEHAGPFHQALLEFLRSPPVER